MEDMSLASELLHEVKASARRWFIIALIELGLILSMAAGFVWYVTLPVEETLTEYSQEMDDVENSTATQMIGGKYNGNNEADSP